VSDALRFDKRRAALPLALACVAALLPIFATSSYLRFVAALTLMYMTVATAWNILGGLTGYVSLGHAAFFGFGAYAAGIAVVRLDLAHTWVVLPAGLLTGVVAGLIGRAALRARAGSFVILTLTLVYISGLVAQGWRGLTGGSRGIIVPNIYGVPRTELHVRFYYVFLALLVVTLMTWWVIRRSRFGLAFMALRDDEDRAESLGIPTTTLKMCAFVLSASLTGLAGAAYALWFRLLDPGFVFSIGWSASVALMALLGGTRHLWGPCLGALILVPSGEYLLHEFGTSEIHLALSGALLIVVVLVLPGGVIPALQNLRARRRIVEPFDEDARSAMPRRTTAGVIP